MTEPVTTAQARFQAKIDEDVPAETVTGYIARARGWVETCTGHLLTERTITVPFDRFDRLRLRAWPVKADTAVLSYRDRAGGIVALPVRMIAGTRPARILPAIGTCWPSAVAEPDAISVTVTAGYADPASVPGEMIQAMLLLITAFYVDREGGETLAQAETAARRLCSDFRLRGL